jgi:hypothetical protein
MKMQSSIYFSKKRVMERERELERTRERENWRNEIHSWLITAAETAVNTTFFHSQMHAQDCHQIRKKKQTGERESE